MGLRPFVKHNVPSMKFHTDVVWQYCFTEPLSMRPPAFSNGCVSLPITYLLDGTKNAKKKNILQVAICVVKQLNPPPLLLVPLLWSFQRNLRGLVGESTSSTKSLESSELNLCRLRTDNTQRH